MTNRPAIWLKSGNGTPPERRWAFATEAPLVALDLARETGETLLADASGTLCLLDRRGQVTALTRGYHPLRGLAWADNGTEGAAIIGETRVCRFNRKLKVEQTIDLTDTVLAVAVAPHGRQMAVSLAGRRNLIFDEIGREAASFETVRPLSFLAFAATEPALIGAADYGLLCWHEFSGAPLWSENLWSNVGDFCMTGDGGEIFLAGFTHGVQIYDRDGDSLGSLILEGTPNHVAASFAPKRLAVTTLERHLYWLDADGQMLWTAELPDDPAQMRCDPMGRGLICGFQSGRVERLDWR